VDEGLVSCPPEIGSLGSMRGCGNGVRVPAIGHRQTKEAETDKQNQMPPRHISTLPNGAIRLI